mmetsp:Transcript_31998/g.82935  ORF Transcript_31998/g.82935 Transcript_31998/m.82935 type:complete len:214 (+) Transcript_31998:269-910(+)
MLFLHGNAGNMGFRLPNVALMQQELRANVFIFDFRGYGASEGRPSEHGILQDAQAALLWLHTHPAVVSSAVFVFGRSLGATLAALLASSVGRSQDVHPIAGLVLENCINSVSDAVDAMFPFLAFPELKQRFLGLSWSAAGCLADIRAPILMMAGKADEIIGFHHHLRLFSSAPPSTLFRCYEKGRHNDTWQAPGYWVDFSNFLDACLKSHRSS